MSGTTGAAARTPTEIKVRKQSRLLEVTFDDGQRFAKGVRRDANFGFSAEPVPRSSRGNEALTFRRRDA